MLYDISVKKMKKYQINLHNITDHNITKRIGIWKGFSTFLYVFFQQMFIEPVGARSIFPQPASILPVLEYVLPGSVLAAGWAGLAGRGALWEGPETNDGGRWGWAPHFLTPQVAGGVFCLGSQGIEPQCLTVIARSLPYPVLTAFPSLNLFLFPTSNSWGHFLNKLLALIPLPQGLSFGRT